MQAMMTGLEASIQKARKKSDDCRLTTDDTPERTTPYRGHPSSRPGTQTYSGAIPRPDQWVQCAEGTRPGDRQGDDRRAVARADDVRDRASGRSPATEVDRRASHRRGQGDRDPGRVRRSGEIDLRRQSHLA